MTTHSPLAGDLESMPKFNTYGDNTINAWIIIKH